MADSILCCVCVLSEIIQITSYYRASNLFERKDGVSAYTLKYELKVKEWLDLPWEVLFHTTWVKCPVASSNPGFE